MIAAAFGNLDCTRASRNVVVTIENLEERCARGRAFIAHDGGEFLQRLVT